jgi:hypothetical protein
VYHKAKHPGRLCGTAAVRGPNLTPN